MEPANTETLSPEAQALLSAIRAQGFSGWAFMTIPQLRAMMMGLNDLAGETNFAGAVEEARISEDVTALIYRQPSAPPAPLLLYFTRVASWPVTQRVSTAARADSRTPRGCRSRP